MERPLIELRLCAVLMDRTPCKRPLDDLSAWDWLRWAKNGARPGRQPYSGIAGSYALDNIDSENPAGVARVRLSECGGGKRVAEKVAGARPGLSTPRVYILVGGKVLAAAVSKHAGGRPSSSAARYTSRAEDRALPDKAGLRARRYVDHAVSTSGTHSSGIARCPGTI